MNTLHIFINNFLKLKKNREKKYIFCEIRKRYMSFNKEEVIRQYVIFLLKNIGHYKNSNISVESSMKMYESIKRYDVLVRCTKKNPYILIECKSPYQKITQKTFDQISMYNQIINASFLWISNGIKNYIFQVNKHKKKYLFIKHIPLRK